MLFGLFSSTQPAQRAFGADPLPRQADALINAPMRTECQVKVETYPGAVGAHNAKKMLLPQPIIYSKNPLAGSRTDNNRTNQGCRVYVGKELNKDNYVAVKEIVLRHSKKNLSQEILHAQSKYKVLQKNVRSEHDYLYGINSACGPRGFYVNDKKTRLYLVQNLMSGSCQQVLDAIKPQESDLPARGNVMMMCALIARHAAEIHARQVIHFDIKPINIMYSKQQDRVEIIDFGLAKVGPEAKQIHGSRGYQSAKHQTYQMCTKRTDVVSLGITFAELMIGGNVFLTGPTINNFLDRHEGNFPAIQDRLTKFSLVLATRHAPFAALCEQMIDDRSFPNLTSSQVYDRLRIELNLLPEFEFNEALDAWRKIPDYVPSIAALVASVDAAEVRINAADRARS